MGRKPNYKFERLERQRAKAAKKATRLEASKEKAERKKADNEGLELADTTGELPDTASGDGSDQ